jgi:hypothetical protein
MRILNKNGNLKNQLGAQVIGIEVERQARAPRYPVRGKPSIPVAKATPLRIKIPGV